MWNVDYFIGSSFGVVFNINSFDRRKSVIDFKWFFWGNSGFSWDGVFVFGEFLGVDVFKR